MSAYERGWYDDEFDDGSDYLPPEDGGAEVMLPDVGDIEVVTGAEMPPVQREQMQADEAEIAMQRLLRRIAERDNPPGLSQRLGNPMGGIVDPWAQTQGGQLAPAPIPTAAVPPAAPMPAVPLAPGMATPPPLPAPAPAMPTATDAPPDATTAPQAPTVTAGSQAQGLAQQAPPQRSPMAPTNAPQFAMGATGLGGAQADMSQRVAAGEAAPNNFDRRLDAARAEDLRRERLRKILLGVGAMLAGGTGNMGLMLPAAIGAGLVRRPDEEATLRAGDAREQELGTEAARRQAMMDQLAQRRAAQEATERNQQQTLALRMQELQGTQEDRRLRTGIDLRENEREEELLDPGSAVSARERQALQLALQGQPREVAARYQGLDRLSATELRSLRDDLERGGRARTIAGQGRAQPMGGVGGGPLASVDAAPDSYVRAIQQASPSMSAEDARRAANVQWARLDDERQANWLASPDAQRLAQVVGRNLPGYEQEASGAAISEEAYNQARTAVANQQVFDAAMTRALGAASQIEALPAAEQAAIRAGDIVGYEGNDALAAYNDARGAIIATLNRLAEAGVMNESEYQRWETQLPRISDFRALGDATRRLRQVQQRVREMTNARLAASGYRPAAGAPPTTTTEQPGTQQAQPSAHEVVVTFQRGDERRTVRMPRNMVDRARARLAQRGWEVVQ